MLEILLDIAWPRDSQFKLDRLVYPDVTFRFNFKYFTDTDCEKKGLWDNEDRRL